MTRCGRMPAVSSTGACLTSGLPPPLRPQQAHEHPAGLCLHPPERLDDEEHNALQRVLDDDPPLASAHALMQRFRRLVRDQDCIMTGLETGLTDAANSDLPPLVGFTRAIAADQAAGHCSPHTPGTVEGCVHKIKLLKRAHYGGSSLPQLRALPLAA